MSHWICIQEKIICTQALRAEINIWTWALWAKINICTQALQAEKRYLHTGHTDWKNISAHRPCAGLPGATKKATKTTILKRRRLWRLFCPKNSQKRLFRYHLGKLATIFNKSATKNNLRNFFFFSPCSSQKSAKDDRSSCFPHTFSPTIFTVWCQEETGWKRFY